MQSLQDENVALRNTLQEMSRLALPSELIAEQPVQVLVTDMPPQLIVWQHRPSVASQTLSSNHHLWCHNLCVPMQLADGIDSDWLSKWQKTAGTFGVQAERNKLTTTQADVSRSADARSAAERINEAYFDSYGFFGIHREMISDKVICLNKTGHAHCLLLSFFFSTAA